MSTEETIKIDIESPEDEENKAAEEEAAQPEEMTGEKPSSGEEAEAEESEEAKEPEEAAGDEKEEKKRFGKKKKPDPKDEKIADLEDRVKRQMAEFENFRKRTDREKSQMYDMGAKSVIEKILPVIDNFERGLENIPEGSDEAFADGMQKIYKQFTTELEKIGVKPIEAVGQPFDPNFHNAVMQVESEEYESGIVAQELQKGYMYHDTLVRPSMVAVVS